MPGILTPNITRQSNVSAFYVRAGRFTTKLPIPFYRKTIHNFSSGTSTDRNSGLSTFDERWIFQAFQRDLEGALGERFSVDLPFVRIRKNVRVGSLPPNAMDPGTLLVGWLRNLHVAELLALGEHKSASIHIRLLESKNTTWRRSERCEKALTSRELHQIPWSAMISTIGTKSPSILRPDFEVVLTPFKRLRQFQRAEVTFPEPLKGAREFVQELEMLLTRAEPFGTCCDPNNDALGDRNIQQACQSLKNHMCIASRNFKGQCR